jgi:hypothetical protein
MRHFRRFFRPGVEPPRAWEKIGIACQGPGSQTAFTAVVVSAFFKSRVHVENQIVSFSGTSGGDGDRSRLASWMVAHR